MTEKELHTNFYALHQKSGFLDHLKAQIRGKLVSDLYKIAEPVESGKFPETSDVEVCLLPLQEKEVLLEKEITNKYEMKMRDVESDFASKLYYKDKEIESLKMKLLEKDEKLIYVETALTSEKGSYTLLKQELNDLKHMYKTVKDKYASVLDENTSVLKKV